MPPKKREPWTGVRDAFELGLRSPQLSSAFHGQVPPEFESMDRNEPMGEDCLVLNVWTPGVGRGGGKRPVMVWLHGGGYTSGSGGFICYDGTELARKHDVVAITVNHRLTVFGYLYLAGIGKEKYAKSSNMGMLDIVAGLEWVRDNIAAFGGDPGNVTIFGQSGGGGKVSTLMAMPSAHGLFHRAIVESGAAVKGVSRDAANKSAERYLAKLSLKQIKSINCRISPWISCLLQPQTPTQCPTAREGSPSHRSSMALRFLMIRLFRRAAPSANIPLLIVTTETEVTFFPGRCSTQSMMRNYTRA